MSKITLTGNLFVQLAGEAKPAPLPLNLELDYTEKQMGDYTYAAAQTNEPLAMGTVTAPRFIYIEVAEGEVSLSWAIAGTAPWKFSSNPTPQVGDPPARGIMFTFAPLTGTLYVTTAGPAKFKVWFFE